MKTTIREEVVKRNAGLTVDLRPARSRPRAGRRKCTRKVGKRWSWRRSAAARASHPLRPARRISSVPRPSKATDTILAGPKQVTEKMKKIPYIVVDTEEKHNI